MKFFVLIWRSDPDACRLREQTGEWPVEPERRGARPSSSPPTVRRSLSRPLAPRHRAKRADDLPETSKVEQIKLPAGTTVARPRHRR